MELGYSASILCPACFGPWTLLVLIHMLGLSYNHAKSVIHASCAQ